LFGSVALGASPPRLGLGYLHDFSVNADPAKWWQRWRRFLTIAAPIGARFPFGTVAGKTSRLGLRLGQLDGFSVNADPAFITSALRLLSGKTWIICIRRLGHWNDLFVNTGPASWWRRRLSPTPGARFLFGSVALTTPLLAIRLATLDDDFAVGPV
jgi:hypothetical protein